MPRTKRNCKAVDRDRDPDRDPDDDAATDPLADFQPLPASADLDNDNDDDDYVSKPAAKRGRRPNNASTTSRKSAASRASKAKAAAAHIPFEPHAIDDPIPEAPARPLLDPPSGDTSPYGAAEISPFPWQLPVTVPETASNWWQLMDLDPGNPQSAVLLLGNETFTSSTLLTFPDEAHLHPETSAFVGPPEFAFFQVPYFLREPILQCKRPRLESNGLQSTDYRCNPIFESHTYSLPVDMRDPLLKRQFDGTGDNFTLYSDVFNKHLRGDKHLERYMEKNKGYHWFPGGSTPLAFLREIKFVPRAHFVRPASVPAVGDSADAEPSELSELFLFDVGSADSIGLKVTPSMEEYLAVLVRPHPKESYTTDGSQGESDSKEQPNELQERTSWRYIASVYLRLDKLQAVFQGPNKAQSQSDVHALLKLFSQTRPVNFRRPRHGRTDPALASSTDFANRARQLEISVDPISTFSSKHIGEASDSSGFIVQLGPDGPFYDPNQGLFASHYSALSGELTTIDGRRPKHVIHYSRSSGLVGRPIYDKSISNRQRMLNALHLIAAQPCTRPEPIPTAHLPRMPSRATLIVTAGVCIAHWESLAHQVLGSSASIVTLTSVASLQPTSLRDMLVADVVIISDKLLLDPNAWTRRAVFPKDFSLENVTPNKLQLTGSQQEYYYGTQEQHAAYMDFLRQDVPARRFEHMATWRSSPNKNMVEATASFFADVTVAYWHRIVLDRWTEVSSLYSLLASRAWVALDPPDRVSYTGNRMGFAQGGVFMDLAHTLSVVADTEKVPLPAVEFEVEQVYTSPVDLALEVIGTAQGGHSAQSWVRLRISVANMRTSDEDRGYPYLSASVFDKWKLFQVAKELGTMCDEFRAEQQAAIHRLRDTITQVHSAAKDLKALELTLAVLYHGLKKECLASHGWIRTFLEDVVKDAPEVKLNEHIDFDRFQLRNSSYDRYAYRPAAYDDTGASLWDYRTLDSHVQAVLGAVKSLAKARTGWDSCEGALRLVRNTTKVEGWMAKIVHGGQQGVGEPVVDVICCPSCNMELADDTKLVVSSTTLAFAHCPSCLPTTSDLDCQLLKFEFAPVPNIKRSRQWLAHVVEAEERGSKFLIWPRTLIQSLVLQAMHVLSSDTDARADAEPKRIAMFMSADHVKAASRCFKLFNVPCVKLNGKHAYKSLKKLYSAQANAIRDDENSDMAAIYADTVGDESSNASGISAPKHVAIVLVDVACPRINRVRIPGVTHVFLGSRWRDIGPATCVATALRPPNEEQREIKVVTFTGDAFCDTGTVDSSLVARLPPRKYE
ncbi:hypothetical protein BCR44DRAFT_1516980 [Catenaria anguillulae PL171]|uniref:Uncharacterized protein n=1 Tax=Catenaria anguillulae PL171 TaxID=765915 RepID=A0A1Y2H7H6_9FUNG|nr:hypothetical protein BCR44DRAFT_1516980 [Catenaria anguillulae PL171]